MVLNILYDFNYLKCVEFVCFVLFVLVAQDILLNVLWAHAKLLCSATVNWHSVYVNESLLIGCDVYSISFLIFYLVVLSVTESKVVSLPLELQVVCPSFLLCQVLISCIRGSVTWCTHT